MPTQNHNYLEPTIVCLPCHNIHFPLVSIALTSVHKPVTTADSFQTQSQIIPSPNSVPSLFLPKMAENPTRFAIIGCAEIARKVARAITLTPNATLYAVASRSLQKARDFAAKNNLSESVKIYGSYDQVLEDPCVDALYIPLPTSLHLQWAVLAANKKKHLLLEKPTAIDVAELDQILEACESNGVQFMDGTMWLHHPRTATMEHLLSASDSRSIGGVSFVSDFFFFLKKTRGLLTYCFAISEGKHKKIAI